jgi:hypothetical protein
VSGTRAADGVPRTPGDPLSPETEEYLALRKRGLRLPSRADLLQRLDDCEEALRLAEAAQPAPGLDALAAAYHKARLRYATGTYYCGSESGPFEFDSGPCSCRMDMRETLAEYARLRGDE